MNAKADAVEDRPIALTLERVFDAPRDLVFSMWSDRKHMTHWFGPKDFTITDVGLEVRAGGRWFCHMRSPSGKDHNMGGIYREIIVPERIMFSHAWEDEKGQPGHETEVTVTLEEIGKKTRLTFHQTGFETNSARDSHEEGWGECLDRLEGYISEQETGS